MSNDLRLLVKNAKQIVLVCNNGERYLTKDGMKKLALMENASLVVGKDGLVKAVGPAGLIDSQYKEASFENVIDASGMCVIPGLIDAHTHPVWAGDRVHEFAMKLAGATYMELHQAGGGIHYTVEHTSRASPEQLLAGLRPRLLRMLRAGTTLAECKSGYGLELDAEVKMLSVIEQARRELPIGISSTYCGAHAVPSGGHHIIPSSHPWCSPVLKLILPGKARGCLNSLQEGKTASQATDEILKVHLPKLKDKMSKGELSIDNIDVFCEKGVFDLNCTRAILKAGQDIGLQINFHGDELYPTNSAELGAELSALAVSHLEEVSDEGIAAMAKSKTSAVLLPTTAYILRLKQPRARDMLDAGVIVALGSDFNPNAYCCSMPIVMHLGCVNMKMSMNEALAAATINAAYALGKSHLHGSLEVDKQGDLIILNSARWEHLIYQFGGHQELIRYVIIKGMVVYDNDKTMDY